MSKVTLSKQSFIAIIDFLGSHPKRVLAFCVAMLFSVPLLRDVGGAIQDLHVYQNVAQMLFHGGILYKDAIDTKNTGFFIAFMLYYWPYALLFKTMAYYHVFQAVVLSVCYWLIAMLAYKIAEIYSSKPLALFSGVMSLCFMATMEYTFMMNQSQIAVLALMFFIWYLMRTDSNRRLYHYIIYGALIGAIFMLASPYLIVCLIIPIIAWNPTQRKRIFVFKGILAFLGFVLVLLPLFIYFIKNEALIQWFEWTFIFPSQDYNNMTLADKISVTFRGMMWSTPEFTPWVTGLWAFGHYSIMDVAYAFWGVILALWIIRSPVSLSSSEKFIITISSLTLIARLTLVRGYLSYNLYIIPFVFLLIPITVRILRASRFKIIYLATMGFLTFWFLLVFIYISIAGWRTPSYQFDQVFVYLINQNISKTPTYISGANYGNTVSYSTRWIPLYYSAWDFRDGAFSQAVFDKNPESIFFSVPDQKLNEKSELSKDFIEFVNENYKVVPEVPYWYLRKDVYDSWNLRVPDAVRTERRKRKMDLIDVDLYGK